MIVHLQIARAIELSQTQRNICTTDDFKGTFPGLYNRRLIDIKVVLLNGDEILSVYITEPGINFLNEYKKKSKTRKPKQYFQFTHYFFRLAHFIKLAQ